MEADTKENSEEHEKKPRQITVPGEIIVSGTQYLPGEYTRREGQDIIATRYGLLEQNDRLFRIIPLSGVYLPRIGNTVIGKVIDITFNGWLLDINSPYHAFLTLAECRGFISKKEDLSAIYNFGDMISTKITNVKSKGVDVTMKDKGLHKLDEGMIITVNSNKVPRVIGKAGSMINMIKTETGCNIIVGQNGVVWIRGENAAQELLAKEAIKMIVEKSFTDGLTEQVSSFLEKHRPKEKKEEKGEKE